MKETEFQDLATRLELGETLTVVEQFMFDLEQKRWAAGPNILQQMDAQRRENPLLKPMDVVTRRAGAARQGRD